MLSCSKGPNPGEVQDEARLAGRSAASFPAADEDYFHDMDGGVALTPEEIKGRNMWIVWTGGDDKMWDTLTVNSVGTLDLLKTISSYPDPKLKANRDNRWTYLGLVNEPCFKKATGPAPDRYDLWLDERDPSCPPDPFENESKYPGVKIGARGKNMPVGSYYGYATGIVGLRLFPNPDFDEAAAKKWDAKRFYTDPSYYNDKNLVRPYRVGMSCGFCHVGPSPTSPPADPENPKWENLSSIVGAQYFWTDRILAWESDDTSFPIQLFHTYRPGTLDTSLISTDNINNPRTMNAFYQLPARMEVAKRWGKETLAGGGLNNKQLNDYIHEGSLTQFFQAPAMVWTPRVLKDGADSVGVMGALNRVYLNIGLFSEEWLLHFRALVGGKPITPIEIAVANKNSAYWEATQMQTPNTALFFLNKAIAAPHHLKDAPGGDAYLTKDRAQLEKGKVVFAERCARCHSSKIPPTPQGVDLGGCNGKDYLDCWTKYWAWTKTDDFKSQMRKMVQQPDFLDNNYLSIDQRVPVTLLQTNACSPLATNAIGGNIWDNFSSQTYKDLPSVGSVTVNNPITGEASTYNMPAGGRGYTRPPSLVSVWSTAPFLLNNSVGKFDPSPSVAARMASFQNSIEKMLWPEKRDKDPVLGDKLAPGPSLIDRTTAASYLRIPGGYLPDFLRPLLSFGARFFPWIFGEGGVQIGPIPKGTPVALLASLDLLGEEKGPAEKLQHQKEVLDLFLKMKLDLASLPPNASDEQAKRVFANLVPGLLQLSKCPDYVVNRGHYFGTSYFQEEPGLSDDDKRALIEYMKTF
jgi:cytochrome c5